MGHLQTEPWIDVFVPISSQFSISARSGAPSGCNGLSADGQHGSSYTTSCFIDLTGSLSSLMKKSKHRERFRTCYEGSGHRGTNLNWVFRPSLFLFVGWDPWKIPQNGDKEPEF
ncbi:hypothetical protein XENORESO_018081 [Xenotaenia resolanae]|uniref:Uncharacterized protein n=1 Tax=Xenotaenia resolanae TaxID=208358 RepID=A0ABV0W4Y3_9TELE